MVVACGGSLIDQDVELGSGLCIVGGRGILVFDIVV